MSKLVTGTIREMGSVNGQTRITLATGEGAFPIILDGGAALGGQMPIGPGMKIQISVSPGGENYLSGNPGTIAILG